MSTDTNTRVTQNRGETGGVSGRRRLRAQPNRQAPRLLQGRRPLGTQQRPRVRSRGLVILAALLVIGTGLAVAVWGSRAGDRVSVLAVDAAVPKGQVIQREDLASVAVAGLDGAIPIEEVNSVAGQTAAVDLVRGQVLTGPAVTSDPVPAPGQSTLGLALEPSRVPGAGLTPGDVVDLIAVPTADGGGQGDTRALNSPRILAAGAQVFDVALDGDGSAGGLVLLTVVVDANQATRAAAYSTQNRVAVVESNPADAPQAPGQTPSTSSSQSGSSGGSPDVSLGGGS